MKLIKTEHEVTRASFQMRDYDISYLFIHTIDGGNVEYRVENYRGHVLKSQVNPKATFHNWVLGYIKDSLSNYAVSV